jgi:hypothetical protein
MRVLWVQTFLFFCVAVLAAIFAAFSQTPKTDSSAMEFPMTTENRVLAPGWWPTKNSTKRRLRQARPSRKVSFERSRSLGCHAHGTRFDARARFPQSFNNSSL